MKPTSIVAATDERVRRCAHKPIDEHLHDPRIDVTQLQPAQLATVADRLSSEKVDGSRSTPGSRCVLAIVHRWTDRATEAQGPRSAKRSSAQVGRTRDCTGAGSPCEEDRSLLRGTAHEIIRTAPTVGARMPSTAIQAARALDPRSGRFQA